MLRISLIVLAVLALLLVVATVVLVFSSKKGKPPGLVDGRLADCPDSPNCVSSDATDPSQFVAPLTFDPAVLSPAEAWEKVQEAVKSLPGTKISEVSGDYLSAECSSRVLGFVDDLELLLRPDDSEIAIRSASRVGKSDLGANRKRVELLRTQFQAPDQ